MRCSFSLCNPNAVISITIIGLLLSFSTVVLPAGSGGRERFNSAEEKEEHHTEADSIAVSQFSAYYINEIRLYRDSQGFPWNYEKDQRGDLFALMGRFHPWNSWDFFVKGGTGFLPLTGSVNGRQSFNLLQGHISSETGAGMVKGKLFLRERVFNTHHRLLKIISDDSPFLKDRSEGLKLTLGNDGEGSYLSWTIARMHSINRMEDNYGFSMFCSTRDYLGILRGSTHVGEFLRAGVTFSRIHSSDKEDAVMIAMDLGLKLRELRLLAELARTRIGRWNDLTDARVMGIRPLKFSLDNFSGIFSPENTFAAEIAGIRISRKWFGEIGILPGYRMVGEDFRGYISELSGAFVEKYIDAWWKSDKYDGMFVLTASDIYKGNRDKQFSRIEGRMRLRFKGGFELIEGVQIGNKTDDALLVSILSDWASTRLSTAVKLYDPGRRNRFFFSSQATMNMRDDLRLHSALYLHDSAESYYNVGLEFRPGKRFRFNLSAGTYSPYQANPGFYHHCCQEAPQKRRFISFYTRAWFGDF